MHFNQSLCFAWQVYVLGFILDPIDSKILQLLSAKLRVWIPFPMKYLPHVWSQLIWKWQKQVSQIIPEYLLLARWCTTPVVVVVLTINFKCEMASSTITGNLTINLSQHNCRNLSTSWLYKLLAHVIHSTKWPQILNVLYDI